MKGRIVTNLPNAEYHAHDALSASGLKEMLRSPAHYQAYREGERIKSTEALAIGRLTHTVILEPDRAASEFFIYDGDRRGSAWTAAVAANPGRMHIRQSWWDDACRVRDAVWAHPDARVLLGAPGRAEDSVFWHDLDTGLECRCRPDWLTEGGLLVDIKTTRDARADKFARSAGDLGYHMAAAHYAEGIAAVTGGEPAMFPMIFIAVETEPPFAVSAFEFEPAALVRGHDLRQRALASWAEHIASRAERAPSYPPGRRQLVLPRWHMTDHTAELIEGEATDNTEE